MDMFEATRRTDKLLMPFKSISNNSFSNNLVEHDWAY